MAALALLLALVCTAIMPAAGQPVGSRPVKIVALGDSLVAGLGLTAEATFPARLERALRAKGLTVEVVNAGVSGDTSTDGLARLEWSVPEDTDAVILELGANDALRGLDPARTRWALESIVGQLVDRHVTVLLAGMRAPPNMGPEFVTAFEAIYPDLAARFDLVYYPFFLDGVAAQANLNQQDGMHPNAAGIDVIVQKLLPKVEELVARARRDRGL
jgi:acyl-CoA thioesterase-1